MLRVLVATDGSPHANKTVQLAARLARELRSVEVVMIAVGHIPVLAYGSPQEGWVDFGALERSIEEEGLTILDKAVEAFAGVHPPVKRLYRQGDPADEILKAAREHEADVIVMGSHGQGQMRELILGSVSERILHVSHLPVLIVR